MAIKKFYAGLIMTCMAALSANALIYHEQTSKVTHFDYSNYQFTYEEDGVTNTAKLTDEATTPEHMAALLKAVYTDPTIPGIHYAYDFNGKQSRKINYNYLDIFTIIYKFLQIRTIWELNISTQA